MGRLFDPPKPPPMPAPVYLPPPPPLPGRVVDARRAIADDPGLDGGRQPAPIATANPAPAPRPGAAPAAAPAPGQPAAAADRPQPRRRWRPDTLATGWRGVLAPRQGAPRRKTLLGE